jgi:eukaryotic-like serine/threonine-protein kinase
MSMKFERELIEACLVLPKTERARWLEANCSDPGTRKRVTRLIHAREQEPMEQAFEGPLVKEPEVDARRDAVNEPVTAEPPSILHSILDKTRELMLELAARYRPVLAPISGIFIAVALFCGVVALQAREIAGQRDEARLQAQQAEASNEIMSLMLDAAAQKGRALTPIELADTGVELIDKQYGDDPRFASRMLLQMARRYMDLRDTRKQRAVFERAEAIARDLGDDDLIAAVECTGVLSEIDLNRYNEAARRMQLANEALDQLSRVPIGTRVDCLRSEAALASSKRDHEAAIAHLEDAQQLLEQSDATHDLKYNLVLTDLGGIYSKTARYNAALEINQRMREALDRNGRGGTMAMATLMINQSSLLYRMGEISAAHEVAAEAVNRMRTLRGTQPLPIAFGVPYGTTLGRLGRWDQALSVLTEASEQPRTAQSDSLRASAHLQLARALLGRGRIGQVAAKLDAAEKLLMNNETATRERLGDLLRARADLAFARGQLDAAKQAIDMSLSKLGYGITTEPSPGLSAALACASKIYLAMDDAPRSAAFARDALSVAGKVARDPGSSADVGEALLALGKAQQAQGDTAAAATLAQANETLRKSLGT